MSDSFIKKEIENIGVLLNVITYRVIEGYYVEESKRINWNN